MKSEAYICWTEIFDNTILDSYKNERKELQKAVMLITALQNEIKNVQQGFEKELIDLREQLKQKDELDEQNKYNNISLTTGNKNGDISEFQINTCIQQSVLDSPDIFINNSLNLQSQSSIIDISLSDEDVTNVEASPTLISKRKKKSKKPTSKICGIKKNILKNVDKENSVLVDCTPKIKTKKIVTNNKTGYLSKKKKRECTLTQMFSDASKNMTCNESKLENRTENELTYLKEGDSELGITKMLSYLNKSEEGEKPEENGILRTENDLTYLKEGDSDLSKTNMLNYINKGEEDEKLEENGILVEDDIDSTQELDEFSKGILFDEGIPVTRSPIKKFKPDDLVEPALRGNARKILKGFSCAQCRDFYGAMKLSPQELQKKIDECSNHRYKYQPPEDTFPGIWDMTIPEENAVRKNSKL